MRQALHIIIWQLSAILLFISSPLKLCQVGWGQTHIFRFLQKFLIGFKLRLWLGHSRTFTELCISHSFCVLMVIVLLEGEPSACLRFWMLWTGFSLRLYFGALSFFSILTSPSVPAAEKQLHSMRLLPPHFTFGMVLCRWWSELVSFKHDWGSSDQRILSLTVWGSFRCFFVNSKCVFMCLHWGEDWVWPHSIKPRSVECCSDVFPLVGFSCLHI